MIEDFRVIRREDEGIPIPRPEPVRIESWRVVWVVARHQGQFIRYCRMAGLIPGVDVLRLTNVRTMLGTRGRRIILLYDWANGIDRPHDFLKVALEQGAVVSDAEL